MERIPNPIWFSKEAAVDTFPDLKVSLNSIYPTSICFCSGLEVAVGNSGGGLTVLSISRQPVSATARWKLEAHYEPVTCLASAPNRQLLYTAGDDGILTEWDVSGRREPVTVATVERGVRCVAVSPDERVIAYSGIDSKKTSFVGLWDLQSKKHRNSIAVGSWWSGFGLCFVDQDTIAKTNQNVTQLWSVNTGECTKELMNCEDGIPGEVTRLVTSPNGRVLAGGTMGGDITIWGIQSGRIEQRILCERDGPSAIVFSPTGRIIAVGTHYDTPFWIYSIEDGTLRACVEGHSGPVLSLDFSPDGNHLVTASRDGTIKLWSTRDFEVITTLSNVYQ